MSVFCTKLLKQLQFGVRDRDAAALLFLVLAACSSKFEFETHFLHELSQSTHTHTDIIMRAHDLMSTKRANLC